MVTRRKYTKRGGSSKTPLSPSELVNFESNPTRFPDPNSYVKGRTCPGTYDNVTAAGGTYSSKPYTSMKGGKPVYCLSDNPLYMDGGKQITPYGPHGGTYASVQSCPPFNGTRPEQIPMKGGRTRKSRGGQPSVIGPSGQYVLSPAPYPANTVSGVGPAGGSRRRNKRRGGSRRRGKRYGNKLGGSKHHTKHNKKHKKYHRGTKSKTRPGHKDYATYKGSKLYRTPLPGMHKGHLAPDFAFVGGAGGMARSIKGYSSFHDLPAKVPPPSGKPNLQPYSNEPISFGYSAGGPPNLSPDLSALANPSPHQSYFNCEKNNFPPPN